MGQSTQMMHMLTKPQAFYDESHKIALGYQNPFYLSQARRKVPALYDGHTIVKTHDGLSITDTEKTLELAKDSRLKMLAKQNDSSLKEKKVNIAPVDYVALNKLFEHFVKNFVTQKQLSIEQAYWLPISNLHIIYQDVMNTVMHANDHSDNVLPADNNSLEHDNSALEVLKRENGRLKELLIS
ncbi:hypothetical protein Tco_1302019 [Tanacetum coccineum]